MNQPNDKKMYSATLVITKTTTTAMLVNVEVPANFDANNPDMVKAAEKKAIEMGLSFSDDDEWVNPKKEGVRHSRETDMSLTHNDFVLYDEYGEPIS